jgi:photosynthetic reaction center H subunit
MIDDGPRQQKIMGWPVPEPKTFLLAHGGEATQPTHVIPDHEVNIAAVPAHPWKGAPLVPTGNPMLDGIGPGAYARRADVPDLTWDGKVKIIPLRVATDYQVARQDVDPRGMTIVGADGEPGGVITDIWIDTAEVMFRYLEVQTPGGRSVMVPIFFCRITRSGVKVQAVLGHQFEDVPAIKHPEQITFLEEEKVMGYFGGGTLYAEPSRAEPLV